MLFLVWLVSMKWVCVILFFYGYIFLLPLVLCASCIPWNFKMQTFFLSSSILCSLNFHCKWNIANHSCFKLSELKIIWHLNESCKQMLKRNFTSQSFRQERCYKFVNISFSYQSTWHVMDRLQQFYETVLVLPSMSFWYSIVKIVIPSLQVCYMDILFTGHPLA
jgi:hypothetical protein